MQPPEEKILQLYYKFYKRGLDNRAIFININHELEEDVLWDKAPISKQKFNKWAPYFFNYTREATYNDMVDGTFMLEKTEELEERFISYISSGIAYDKAASLMNIPLNTLMDVWFKDKLFKARVDYAVEINRARVTMALLKRAIGFTATLTSKTVTKQKTSSKDSNGNKVYTEGDQVMESTTTREELVLPSVEAAKMWLINQTNGDWSLNGQSSNAGNKSKILEAIEAMTRPTMLTDGTNSANSTK